MYIVSAGSQPSHSPLFELFNGEKSAHSEVPTRVKTIEAALLEADYTISRTINKIPLNLLTSIHKPSYISFIKEASESLKNDEYIYPNVFNMLQVSTATSIMTKFGTYSTDVYTPIGKGTFKSAFDSASVAYTVAKKIQSEEKRVGYALCRPPGHHATSSLMGGYCYFNNSALAAQYLSESGKVAILDVDLHHGNGTQEIFYQRPDVYTVSIHADPQFKFPHYSGFTEEVGTGAGKNFNKNYPLPNKTTDSAYQKTLESAVESIRKYNPSYLVIALGLDTFVDDPIGFFSLTTEYFKKMATTINSLDLPTVIVQEGGYNTEELGSNVVSFLEGMDI